MEIGKMEGGRGAGTQTELYDTPVYVRSRRAYLWQAAFEYFVSLLLADAFLAKLLLYIGMSDGMIGVVSSLTSFAFLFQLLTFVLTPHVHNTKKTVIGFNLGGWIFFLIIYLVPFMPFGVPVKTGIVILSFLMAYLLKNAVGTVCFGWANSFVDPRKRGEYSALKEIISLAGGSLFVLAAGYAVERFEAAGAERIGFGFLIALMIVCGLADFYCLMRIGSGEKKNSAARRPAAVWKHILGNRAFVHVIIMISLWYIGAYLTVGFMGTFKTTELALSLGVIQIINVAASLCRILISGPFGRYSDRTPYAKGYRTALLCMAAAFAVNVFTAPERKWLVFLYTLLYQIGAAGTGQNGENICYNYVDREYMVSAMAIKNCISGLLGFGASLVGSRILTAIQERGNQICGIRIYGQQLLSALSCMFMIAAFLYAKHVVEKQERIIQ